MSPCSPPSPGGTLAAAAEPASPRPAPPGTPHPAPTTALSALGHAGALMRSLLRSRVRGEAPLSLSTPYIDTAGFQGDPFDLLCGQKSDRDRQTPPCRFHIPASLAARLKSRDSEVVQVLFGVGAALLRSNPLLTAADPPISTALVAMELTTPRGRPIPVQDLEPNQAIRVILPNEYPVGRDDGGGGERGGGAGNGTCLTATLPADGRLNLTVRAVGGLDPSAGLYISFHFSLDPGTVDSSSWL